MKKQKIEFRLGVERLRGALFIPEKKGPFPGVVFYHGRGSNRRRYLPIAQRLAKKGILSLAFDFRGCGESDGDFDNQPYKNGIEDAAAALEFLLKQDIDKKRIGILGTSFGGYVTAIILPKYSFIRSILLRAPAAYDDKFLITTVKEPKEKEFFDNKENWQNSTSYQGIRGFKGSLLVIKCEYDGLLPDEMVERYYHEAISSSKRKLEVLKEADHFLSSPTSLAQFYDRVESWFLKTL